MENLTLVTRVDKTSQYGQVTVAQILETVGAGAVITDLNAIITEANSRAAMILALGSRDALIGKCSLDLFAPHDRQRAVQNLRELLEQGAYIAAEYTLVRTDGTELHLNIGSDVLRDTAGNAVGFVLTLIEITGPERTWQMLGNSEVKLWSMLDSVSDGIVIMDLKGVVVRVNQRVAEMHGVDSREAILGENVLQFVAQRDRKRAMEGWKKALEQGTASDIEYTLIRVDGSEFPGETSTSVLENGKNNPFALITIVRDITERKQQQESLQKLYRQEKKLRRKLESEIQKRVELTRALVHELKTPITPVMASSGLLVAELRTEPWLSLAQNIHRGAINLNRKINELLDMAKGELGILKLKLGTVSPQKLLQEVVTEMTPLAVRRNHNLTLQAQSLPVDIHVDKLRLQQVLFNLLNNACRFTREGGHITVRAKQDQDYLIVEVEDTGPGLTAEDQQHIFEPYHFTERDRERLSGLGLGLSLCKNLVELHRGEIWVKSEKGKGCTFGFSVPLNPSLPAR